MWPQSESGDCVFYGGGIMPNRGGISQGAEIAFLLILQTCVPWNCREPSSVCIGFDKRTEGFRNPLPVTSHVTHLGHTEVRYAA
jgi:hypothetical protein